MVAQILLRDSRQGSAKVLFDSQRRTGQLLGCFYRAKLFTFNKPDKSLAHFLASKRRPGKLFFYFLCYLKTLELKLHIMPSSTRTLQVPNSRELRAKWLPGLLP